jgi:3-isopropylmalate/(R)-2-methylmalate dehydratase large subunit
MVSWGTNPAQVVGVAGAVPEPSTEGEERALEYMGLQAGTPIEEIKLDRVFIGSCTNSRIGDLRAGAKVSRAAGSRRRLRDGRPGLGAGEGPGRARGPRRDLQGRRLRLARRGLLDVPGDEPRHLQPGERCASTSNRNFEGRQGRGGRTHLVSPEMAAAAAIEGRFVDIRSWN